MKHTQPEETRQFYANVGQRIASLRSKQFTQQTLASKTGLTRTAIVNIEKGRQQIFLHTIIDIADALNVAVSDIIPQRDDIKTLLRDKTPMGVEWVVKASRADLDKGVSNHGNQKETD
jgi:transcriptional regulator with XRE-family HTH domain